MSEVAEVETDDPEQHTLTYQGRVNPKPGTFMGPGMDGRAWRVLGAIYYPPEEVTHVVVEEYVRA